MTQPGAVGGEHRDQTRPGSPSRDGNHTWKVCGTPVPTAQSTGTNRGPPPAENEQTKIPHQRTRPTFAINTENPTRGEKAPCAGTRHFPAAILNPEQLPDIEFFLFRGFCEQRRRGSGAQPGSFILYPLSSILYPGPRSGSRPDAAPCPRSAAAQPRSPRAFPGLSRALPEPSRHFPSITTSRLSGFSPKQGRKRKSSSNPLSPLSLPLLISLPCTCPFRHGLSKLCGKIKLSRSSPPHHATIPDIPNCSQKTPLLLCTLLRQKHPQNPLRVASSPICPLTNAHQRKS